MKELSHPFTSNYYYSYESDVSIDILMGLIPGGDLWALVHKENPETGEWLSGIPETHAQFYSMVVADTLSFIHNKGYIYRDLKFENIMIDAKGCKYQLGLVACDMTLECRTNKLKLNNTNSLPSVPRSDYCRFRVCTGMP
jgi:serine/threonine protein kinase